MKVCLISDTHINITTAGQLDNMMKEVAQERFDLLVHCGDYCGGQTGHKSVRPTIKIIRKHYQGPMITTIGNHDFWVKSRDPIKHDQNYEKIVKCFKDNNVHFIDEDGIYSHLDFPLIKFMGVSGWYQKALPTTNDINFLRGGNHPNAHEILRKRSYDLLFKQLDDLDIVYDEAIDTVIFVSHFPVIRANDYKGGFDDFAWSESLGEMIQREYNCKMFLNGHAHMNYSGPLRYESGSDYYNPKYKIINI